MDETTEKEEQIEEEKLTRKETINKRRKLIKDYLLKQPNKTQEQIIEYLVKQGMPHYGQATIQRDLKELRFVNTPKGYRRKQENYKAADDEQLMQCFTFDGSPRIHSKPLFTVVIKIQNGTASRIAQIIDRKYGNRITGTIAGENLVLVFTTKEVQAKKIAQEMIKLRSASITPDLSDDDQEQKENNIDLD